MSQEDFEGQEKYKYVVPIVYIVSWISMVLGPWMVPVLYSQYCMCILIYLALRSLFLCGQNAQLVINSHQVLKNVKNNNDEDSFNIQPSSISIYHTFIIPNYNEPIELLFETLQILSRHKKSVSTYIVFLAMEKHQKNSEDKALELVNQFKGKFLYIGYSLHELRENEHKGKAANVNWCVENVSNTFEKLMIHEENVMITVMDADSWVPQIYVKEVQTHLASNFEKRHSFIYQPPQIYSRNNMNVSVFIRTYDDMYSSMHASSLISLCGVSFSLSNYTLSYCLVKRVGFWDTAEEAIGEDMHMCLKAVFKTDGEIETVPIFVPFNQLNIETGNGPFTDLKQKFWQVERHARGVADIGYCLNMLSKNQSTFKAIWMTISLIETFFLPILTPWPLFFVFFQFGLDRLGLIPQKGMFTFQEIFFVVTIINTGTFVSNLIYEIFKRRANKKIYDFPNPNILHVLQCSFLSTINLLFMTVPAFVIGGFGNLSSNRQYIVTKKNSQFRLRSKLIEQL